MKRKAQSVWQGTVKEGHGYLTTGSAILNQTPYSFNSRFDNGAGTNPEELLAAAHAGCFNMKLSSDLSASGFEAIELVTEATVSLVAGKIESSHLVLRARIDNITNEEFQLIAERAKDNCPVSQGFSFSLSLEAQLVP